jgi:hypothetical protein
MYVPSDRRLSADGLAEMDMLALNTRRGRLVAVRSSTGFFLIFFFNQVYSPGRLGNAGGRWSTEYLENGT